MSRRANGEGSIYFDSNRGRWVGAIDAGVNPKTGKRRRAKVVGSEGESKSSVAARLRAKISDLETSSPTSPDTVRELVEAWFTRAAPKRKSQTTLAMTDSLIRNHIDPVLGHLRVSAVTVEDVEAFLDARTQTHSKSTLDKLRTILAQAFDFGIRRRHLNWNPARVAELPPEAEATREGRTLTASEARVLLSPELVQQPPGILRTVRRELFSHLEATSRDCDTKTQTGAGPAGTPVECDRYTRQGNLPPPSESRNHDDHDGPPKLKKSYVLPISGKNRPASPRQPHAQKCR